MPAVHERRRERLADALTSVGLGSALITTLLNVRYLTGFTGSAGTLLVSASGGAEIATDSRYELQVAQECPDVPARITRSGRRELAASVLGSGPVAVGFEDLSLEVAGWRDLPSGVEWTPLGGPDRPPADDQGPS